MILKNDFCRQTNLFIKKNLEKGLSMGKYIKVV